MNSAPQEFPRNAGQGSMIVRWLHPCRAVVNANLVGWSGRRWLHMAGKGLPISHGFTITTEAFKRFLENDREVPDGLLLDVQEAIAEIEQATGKGFASQMGPPLLFTVITGSPVRMSGLMDDIHGFGLEERGVQQLAERTSDARFAGGEYLTFIETFGDAALGATRRDDEDHCPFMLEMDSFTAGIYGRDVSPSLLLPGETKELTQRYKDLIRRRTGRDFPEDHTEQLRRIIHAAFSSWGNPRAIAYRRQRGISDADGVTIDFRMMAFGNTGEASGAGWLDTRDPVRGTRKCHIEFRANTHVGRFGQDCRFRPSTACPRPLALQLENLSRSVEACFRDACEVQFTVEDGIIHVDRVHPARLTAVASLKITTDLVREGLMSWRNAVSRLPAEKTKHLLGMVIKEPEAEILSSGVPACEGAVSGRIYLDGERAMNAAARGESVLLVREQFRAEDCNASSKACGLISMKGGLSSIAASIARHEGIPCVCGISGMTLDEEERTLTIAGNVFEEGSILTIDGGSGHLYVGDRCVLSDIIKAIVKGDKRAKKSEAYKNFLQLMEWCFRIGKAGGTKRAVLLSNHATHDLEAILLDRIARAQGALATKPQKHF